MKILKINSLENEWVDRDRLLLHAAFQILVDFVEREDIASIDWNYTQLFKDAKKEIDDLYEWWTKIRPNRKNPILDPNLEVPSMEFQAVADTEYKLLLPYDKEKYVSYTEASKLQDELDEKWLAEDQENLHRLVNIRLFLWT